MAHKKECKNARAGVTIEGRESTYNIMFYTYQRSLLNKYIYDQLKISSSFIKPFKTMDIDYILTGVTKNTIFPFLVYPFYDWSDQNIFLTDIIGERADHSSKGN